MTHGVNQNFPYVLYPQALDVFEVTQNQPLEKKKRKQLGEQKGNQVKGLGGCWKPGALKPVGSVTVALAGANFPRELPVAVGEIGGYENHADDPPDERHMQAISRRLSVDNR